MIPALLAGHDAAWSMQLALSFYSGDAFLVTGFLQAFLKCLLRTLCLLFLWTRFVRGYCQGPTHGNLVIKSLRHLQRSQPRPYLRPQEGVGVASLSFTLALRIRVRLTASLFSLLCYTCTPGGRSSLPPRVVIWCTSETYYWKLLGGSH